MSKIVGYQSIRDTYIDTNRINELISDQPYNALIGFKDSNIDEPVILDLRNNLLVHVTDYERSSYVINSVILTLELNRSKVDKSICLIGLSGSTLMGYFMQPGKLLKSLNSVTVTENLSEFVDRIQRIKNSIDHKRQMLDDHNYQTIDEWNSEMIKSNLKTYFTSTLVIIDHLEWQFIDGSKDLFDILKYCFDKGPECGTYFMCTTSCDKCYMNLMDAGSFKKVLQYKKSFGVIDYELDLWDTNLSSKPLASIQPPIVYKGVLYDLIDRVSAKSREVKRSLDT